MATLALADLQRDERIRCKTAILLTTLDEADAQALKSVLDDLSVSPDRISTWLTKNGYPISRDSIRRHRKRQEGGCLCPKDSGS